MTQLRINRAFETILSTWAAAKSPPIAVAWDNMTFNPGVARFLRASVLPQPQRNEFLDARHRRYSGVFQVLLSVRPGATPGVAEAQALAAEVEELFPMNVPLTNGGLTFQLTSPMGAVEAIPEPDKYTIPIWTRYRADTTT